MSLESSYLEVPRTAAIRAASLVALVAALAWDCFYGNSFALTSFSAGMDGTIHEFSLAAGDDSSVSDDGPGVRRHDIQHQYDALGTKHALGAPFVSSRLQPGSRRHRKAVAKVMPSRGTEGTPAYGSVSGARLTPDDTPDSSVGAADLHLSSSGSQGLYISFQDILALQRYQPVAVPLASGLPLEPPQAFSVNAGMVEAGDFVTSASGSDVYRDELASETTALKQTRGALFQAREELQTCYSSHGVLEQQFGSATAEVDVYRNELVFETSALTQTRNALQTCHESHDGLAHEADSASVNVDVYREKLVSETSALHQTRGEFQTVHASHRVFEQEYHSASVEVDVFRNELVSEVTALQQTRDELQSCYTSRGALANELDSASVEVDVYRSELVSETSALQQSRMEITKAEGACTRDNSEAEVAELAASLKRNEARYEFLSTLQLRRLQIAERKCTAISEQGEESAAAASHRHEREQEIVRAELRMALSEVASLQSKLENG